MLSNDEIIAFYQNIGELVKASRKLKNINQETLSNYLGISRVSLVNIENGKQRAPIHVLMDISYFLKIPLKELLPSKFINDENNIDPNFLNKINKETWNQSRFRRKSYRFYKVIYL